MHEQDFATVLERACQGDAEAMARLVEEYEPQIRRVAHSRLGPALRSGVDSTDLVQSVHRSLLLCLRRNKFTFNGLQDLVALAVTMMKRKVARQWRRSQREQELARLRAQMLSHAKPQHTAELARQIQDLLETLNDVDREILKLYLEGYSNEEAASRLDRNPDSLRVRRHRLFGKLRDSGLDIY